MARLLPLLLSLGLAAAGSSAAPLPAQPRRMLLAPASSPPAAPPTTTTPKPAATATPTTTPATPTALCLVGADGRAFKPDQNRPLRVLALGDSLTLGPAADGSTHPYANTVRAELPWLLQQRAAAAASSRNATTTTTTTLPSPPVSVDVVSVPCAGVFELGCSRRATVLEAGLEALNSKPQSYYDYTVVLVGINDLLKGGKPAAEVASKIEALHAGILAKGSSVIALPPLAAPGFVSSRDHPQDLQRRQLAGLLADVARRRSLWTAREAAARSGGNRNGNAAAPFSAPSIVFVSVEADGVNSNDSGSSVNSLLDFWALPDDRRRAMQWDGLHLTAEGSQELGRVVSRALAGAAAPTGC